MAPTSTRTLELVFTTNSGWVSNTCEQFRNRYDSVCHNSAQEAEGYLLCVHPVSRLHLEVKHRNYYKSQSYLDRVDLTTFHLDHLGRYDVQPAKHDEINKLSSSMQQHKLF